MDNDEYIPTQADPGSNKKLLENKQFFICFTMILCILNAFQQVHMNVLILSSLEEDK